MDIYKVAHSHTRFIKADKYLIKLSNHRSVRLPLWRPLCGLYANYYIDMKTYLPIIHDMQPQWATVPLGYDVSQFWETHRKKFMVWCPIYQRGNMSLYKDMFEYYGSGSPFRVFMQYQGNRNIVADLTCIPEEIPVHISGIDQQFIKHSLMTPNVISVDAVTNITQLVSILQRPKQAVLIA